MEVGILKAGQPSADLAATTGSYLELIREALGPRYSYREFDVQQGEFPGPASGAGGYIITGSASSAYDTEPWIARLCDWLAQVSRATPLVGICFGHQIMAQAYGGLVARAKQGLAVGLHEYRVFHREPWMDDVSRFVIPVSHYDQVVERPASARVLAANDLCPYSALTYGDRAAVSFQGHPEAPLDLVAKAIERWQQRGFISAAEADRARSSMQQPDDRARVMRWIGRFLEAGGHDT